MSSQTDEYYNISDYYKIGGETTLHREKSNPKVLETILDHYVQQDPSYILAVLIKENKRIPINRDPEFKRLGTGILKDVGLKSTVPRL